MKSIKDIFSQLGRALESFGSDSISRSIIDMAMRDNEWFTESDIRYAVDAVRREMLDEKRVEKWLSLYPSLSKRGGEKKRVAVIMAGNIPLVGLFDVLCVVASGNRACVKPSSKDSVLYTCVEQLLLNIEPSLPIEPYNPNGQYDAVIATGGDSANLYFRTKFEGVPSLLRGSRHSVAVLSGDENDGDMKALAEDIFLHSGLGCRNVSLVFVPKGFVPKFKVREMCRAYHNNYLQCKALLTMRGAEFEDLGEAVLVRSQVVEFPHFLSQINVVEYTSLAEVQEWLKANDESLQCVVTAIEGIHSRQVPFGKAQRPSLTDYADERDVMKFLCEL